ncbi:MAG TPA: glycosyltransferase family 4 protein [Bryobacteraceae bacterium]|nr:glycosyltransferase family 4 protein [Bryobacteraceae bacterium]
MIERKDSRIRVLVIAPSARILGGQALQARRLLAYLEREPSLAPAFQPLDLPLPSAVERIRFLRTVIRFLLFLPVLLWRVPRYDVIHAFAASYWSYTLWTMPSIIVGRLFGKKVVVHYHSGEAEDHLAHWRSAIPSLMLAHEIVVPSQYLVDVFARFGLRSRAIFNILDTAPLRYRQRGRLRPVFLTNRGLEPLYNVGCVLRAFAIVQRRYPEASLTVAHDGSCRASLEALAAELGLVNTRFVGQVAPEKMPDLYDASDIYLTSPDLDCMPGSILECFASGLPVVATKAGGIPYIVEHERTGLLVNCNDHQALAECALWLLEDGKLASRLAERAHAECVKYAAGPVIRQWVELYHRLAGRSLAPTSAPAEAHEETVLR